MTGECNCDCHNSDIVHAMACCFRCPHCDLNISISLYDKHEKECKILHACFNTDLHNERLRKFHNRFKIEVEYFEQHREELCQYYAGKFVLMKGAIIHGFYDSHTSAYVAGINIFGVDTSFFIKEVQLEDEVICIPTIFGNHKKVDEPEYHRGDIVTYTTLTDSGVPVINVDFLTPKVFDSEPQRITRGGSDFGEKKSFWQWLFMR